MMNRAANRLCFSEQIGFLPVLVACCLALTGAAGALAADPAPAASSAAVAPAQSTLNFVNDVLPLLTKHGCNSGGCHGRGSGQNGFKLSLFGFDPEADYAALVEEGLGRRVSWTAPEESLILAKPTGQAPHGGGVRFAADSAAYQLLSRWISEGSPWGEPGAPILTGIHVEPVEQLLETGQTQQLKVVASYSDNTTRDVTTTAEYFSAQPADLAVTPLGLVRALEGKGEAIVTVRYLGIVAVSRFFAPYNRNLPDQAYAGFEPKSYVDRLVLEKWRKLGLAPSPAASDGEFVRRAYLDAIGTLPKPQEVRDFLTDTSADKRDKLVDRLLEREEYATFWAQRWGDLLRNKQFYSAGDHKVDSQKFADWIRAAFAQNMPFDKFARELITVTGKAEDHPQMDWYRQINTSQFKVEDTSQVFLGLRVSCANCHNHPFERISQNDYWQYAAFFARVDAMSYGTVTMVGVKDEGSMTNPRTGQAVNPKAFGGPEVPFVKGEDPRIKLVDWMVAKENPYFARAISNRIWAHYLKRGLVEAVDDLRATNPPSNPALLDALAADLADHGYDLKHLTKTVMKSRVYGLSAVPRPENAADKRHYARHYPQRMLPHVLLDAISSATGVPAKFAQFPEAKRALQLPNEAQQSDFLDIFGRSRRDSTCVCETHIEPNLSQVLYVMFSPELQTEITSPEGAVASLLKENRSTSDMVSELYLRTVSRPPTSAELADAIALIDAAATTPPAAKPGSTDPPPAITPEIAARQQKQAIEDLLWTLLNCKEFIFNH
jgi:hypothetical protein